MTTTIDVRGTATLVRDALQTYADVQAGRTAGAQLLLQDELAQRIAGELVPALRQLYLEMTAIQVEWQEKSFQAALAAAAANGELLAGFAFQTWHRWGMLLLWLQEGLNTPLEVMGGETPKDALLRRYIPGTDVPTPPTPPAEPDPEQPA